MNSTSNNYLISPFIDFMMLGGFALLTYLFILITGFGNNIDIAIWMFYLAFFVNSPHFMISYEIFYKSFPEKIGLNKQLIVGLIIPSLLFLLISVGIYYDSKKIFTFLLLSMFFLVGWHYIKQSYGCFIVYSAGNKIYYSKKEQNLIKYSLYPLWIGSFLNIFTNKNLNNYWGLEYNFPSFFSQNLLFIKIISISGFFVFLCVIINNYFRERKPPNLIALTPILIGYIWLSPIFWNNIYFYMIPFFHSLQYFLFSGTFTYNVIKKENSGLKGWIKWWGIAFILGALSFEFLPNYLDLFFSLNSKVTPHLFLISFIFFINIHHYFIDSIIWKGSNHDVRKNLLFKE
ncbi:hypothetical protein [Acinetobacter sp.]|uniref:hypothetical protein n=1 Tax=Acinetobacter sp. TaxID=472 RepID=UPI0031D0EC62